MKRSPANLQEWPVNAAARGRMRDKAYLQFLRSHGRCVDICVCNFRYSPMGCDPAHGPANGMGSKGPDDGLYPRCAACIMPNSTPWRNGLNSRISTGFRERKEAKIGTQHIWNLKGKYNE